ncbi:uncharacterized protein G2W53_041393 [Senna tora]|uniref:Retrotransposon Copia-like N-terminal domain-containing protein n=1 Tax=Senna tora TaxID=362788 RepID=A0A834VYR0_9FABA|nr:uncharacterized protein G2W53_041393 [Senna tora]
MASNILSAMLHQAEDQKWLKGIKFAHRGLQISHLMYADDTVLFFKADKEVCGKLKHLLNEYCSLAGQKINNCKSHFVFSPIAPTEFKEYIKINWSMKYSNLLGKYLALPIYQMSIIDIPKEIARKIDSATMNFFWGGNDQKKTMNMIKASIIKRPRREGGLGIRDISNFNKALLAKHTWRFVKRPNSLCSHWFMSKHRRPNEEFGFRRTTQDSIFWKGIKNSMNLVLNNLHWIVGEGGSINVNSRFWSFRMEGNSSITNVADLITFNDSSTGNGSGGSKEQRDEGPFTLHNSDHPGTALVNTPLTGTNYLTWSLAIKTSLEAKDKLGFIDGSLPAPLMKLNSSVGRKLTPWLKHGSTTRLVRTLLTLLFLAIKRRSYGIYWQAGMIDRLVPQPTCQCDKCTCDVNGKLQAITESTRLLQFLMGLNLEFKPIRRHILNLDPLPQVDRALAMVISAESEQEVTMTYSALGVEASAMVVKGQNSFRSDADKKRDAAKKDRVCNHCNVTGHTRETCFKLHGYPEWYKDLKEARKGNGSNKKASVNMAGASNGVNQENAGGKGEEKQMEIASMDLKSEEIIAIAGRSKRQVAYYIDAEKEGKGNIVKMENQRLTDTDIMRQGNSFSIIKIKMQRKKGWQVERRSIGDGKSTRVWEDPLVMFDRPTLLPAPTQNTVNVEKVCDLMHESGDSWDEGKLRGCFDEEICQRILCIPPKRAQGADRWV